MTQATAFVCGVAKYNIGFVPMHLTASVAQSVERTAFNRTVAGSSPAGGSVLLSLPIYIGYRHVTQS